MTTTTTDDILRLVLDSDGDGDGFVDVAPPPPPSSPPPPPPPSRRRRRPRGRRRRRRPRGRRAREFWPPEEYFHVAQKELLRISENDAAFDELCRDWDELHSLFMRQGVFTSMRGFRHTFGPFTKDMFVFSLMVDGPLRALMNTCRFHRRRRRWK